MQCPICKKKGIDDNALACPECNSDLQAFKQLSYLRKTLSLRKGYIIFFIIIIISSIIFMYVRGNSIIKKNQLKANILTEKVSSQQKQIEALKSDKNKLIENIVELRDENYTLKALEQNSVVAKPAKTIKNNSAKFIYHIVKKRENLRSIALKYYGSKSKFTKIMKDNSIKNANHLKIGQKLKIYK